MSIPIRVAVAAALLFPFSAFAQSAITELGEVQVEGRLDRVESERAQTPGNVSVVDGATFHQRAVGNLADSLRYVPGVWAESGTGGDAIFISSRGSNLDATDYDSNGIKLFQDGLPVTTADGNNHNRFIDPLAASRIVVAHGANALTYGASTLGGAIDFITPTAREGAPSQLVVNAGSFGLASMRLTAAGISGSIDGRVTLESRQRDGYREHSHEHRTGVHANAGWKVSDDVDLRLFATYLDSRQQLAGALTRAQFEEDPRQANPSAISGNFQLNVETSRVAAKGHWRIDPASRLEFGMSHEIQDLYHPIVDKVMVDFDGPGPAAPVEVFSLLKNTAQRTAAGMLRYNVALGRHDVLTGVNLADTREEGGLYRNDGGRRNGLRTIVDNRSRSMEVFVVDRWNFATDWTLVYGAQGVATRRDVRNTDVASGMLRNPRADYASINPRVGVITTVGAAGEAYASLSRLYEAPTNFELEDDVRGDNATLDAMHGSVLEIGVRGVQPPGDQPTWRWDVALYYAGIRNEILSIDDPAAPGTSLSANIDRTIHAGLEAVLGASFPLGAGGHRIEPLASISWNAFSFDDDPVYGDNDLPAAPRHAVRGEVMYRNDRGFFAGPTFDLVGSRHADFANTYRIESYDLLGLRLGMERERWSVFAELRNLLDKDHVGTLSVRDAAGASDAILQAGAPRSAYVGLRLAF
ncbi:MAG: TonB-dependent receptor [Pseudomonadota bacterium]|nr:TonB-dependent receptor [Pseudomonadota bacterium]